MTAPELPHAPEADAVGAPVDQPVRPWGTRLDLDAQPVGYDRRQGDILRWREPQVGPLYDQAALDAAVAAERERIDQLLRDHQGVSLETLEYLETMRQGPTREEWAEMDSRARGDGEPGCRDCADNNGTCPHDGHKCGA